MCKKRGRGLLKSTAPAAAESKSFRPTRDDGPADLPSLRRISDDFLRRFPGAISAMRDSRSRRLWAKRAQSSRPISISCSSTPGKSHLTRIGHRETPLYAMGRRASGGQAVRTIGESMGLAGTDMKVRTAHARYADFSAAIKRFSANLKRPSRSRLAKNGSADLSAKSSPKTTHGMPAMAVRFIC